MSNTEQVLVVAAEAAPRSTAWISFSLAGQQYAAPVERVQEVIRPRDIAPVPGAPHTLLGLMNLRGRLLPVIDGCERLALEGGNVGDLANARVLVLDTGDEPAGLLVEAVGDLIRIDESQIAPVPVGRDLRPHDPVRGVVQRERGFTALLDVERLCNAEAISGSGPSGGGHVDE